MVECTSNEQLFFKKTFHFTNERNVVTLSCSSSDSSLASDTDVHVCGVECANIIISEVLNPKYGLYVWPSAPVLAQYIWKNRLFLHGKNVLELGAGTALPSIVAAKCGAFVTVSDGENFIQTLECCKKNFELNNIPVKNFRTVGITWGSFSPIILSIGPLDIILGSDVFYEVDDFEDIIVTVSFLLKHNKQAKFWCTYQERNCDWNIEYLLRKWNLTAEEVTLEEFGASESTCPISNIATHQKIRLFIFKFYSSL